MIFSHFEPHNENSTSKLNALRAAVLGADDGIVSVAGIVLGVAGATSSRGAIFTAGIAGLVAGAMSMAAGEYVSVSSQKDTEKALLKKEKAELRDYPNEELEELASIYRAKGMSRKTSYQVAKELMDHDALAAHAEAELGLNPDMLVNPWEAAISSMFSFIAGAFIPLLAIMLSPKNSRVLITFIAVVLALTITGILSARLGGANRVRAAIRVVIGGVLAMIITYMIGKAVGTTIA